MCSRHPRLSLTMCLILCSGHEYSWHCLFVMESVIGLKLTKGVVKFIDIVDIIAILFSIGTSGFYWSLFVSCRLYSKGFDNYFSYQFCPLGHVWGSGNCLYWVECFWVQWYGQNVLSNFFYHKTILVILST